MSLQHTTTVCPQRSMAWMTLNENEQIISVTPDMIQLLEYDPTNQYLDSVWKAIESDQSYLVVSTFQSLRTLCICTHIQNNKRVLICTDITDLNQMYSKRQDANISITRLTMYGTIEAAFKSPSLPLLAVGQPIMRYIHSDDVQLFCSALSQSGKNNTINTLQLRILRHEDYQWSDFTVMTIEGGRKVLCIIKPTHDLIRKEEQCYDNLLRETVTQIQSKFWYAIENGMNLIAHSLATSLLLVIQTVWQLWYNQDKTWSGLFSTSSEYLVRRLVKSTKQRREIETLCRLISWAGIQQSTTRSFIDNTLDETSDWLLSKTQLAGHGYDTVV